MTVKRLTFPDDLYQTSTRLILDQNRRSVIFDKADMADDNSQFAEVLVSS